MVLQWVAMNGLSNQEFWGAAFEYILQLADMLHGTTDGRKVCFVCVWCASVILAHKYSVGLLYLYPV